MKKLLLSILIVHYATILFSQCDTTYYFNDNDMDCLPDKAAWYRKLHCTDDKLIVYNGTDYYMNDSIKRSTGLYVKEPSGVYPYGKFTSYYPNGKIESKGSYDYSFPKGIRNAKIGPWTEYYPNGKRESEVKYDSLAGNTYNELILACWDSTGKTTLANGNGYRIYYDYQNKEAYIAYNCQYKDGKQSGKQTGTFVRTGKPYCDEEFAEGKFVSGTSYDTTGNKYTYTDLERSPIFPGGDASLMAFLQKNVKYPEIDYNNDIQGKVLLRFIVNETGKVTDIQVVRSVSPGLDKEAVRVVKLLHNFTPGYQRGQAVKVYFNLPVVFRLQ